MWPDFRFSVDFHDFSNSSTEGGFFDHFGRNRRKIEKSMIFRPKIDFDQNCAQNRKKQSKPFPTPKDSSKNIYKRPRNRDFSAFLEGGQGGGRILLGEL